MHVEKLLRISRPRFWIYLFGPFLIGWIAGLDTLFAWDLFLGLSQYKDFLLLALLIIAADYFLFSANLFVYGINDLSDDDTDCFNDKKWTYEHSLAFEERTWLARNIIAFAGAEGMLLMVLLVRTQKNIFEHEQRWRWIVALLLFWITSYFYSSVPIRAKSKPFLDGIFNVLYIVPSLVWRIVSGHSIDGFSWIGFGAWWLWAMAMHAYSAIPDIEPDAKAWITTTAVFLGKEKTLLYCWVLRAAAAFLWFTVFGLPILMMWAVYLIVIALSFTQDIMKLYKRFPWINAGLGFVLFWLIVL